MIARHYLVSTWIAILAVLLNALVPTVSLAFEPAPKSIDSVREGWIEICSTQGSSWVLLGPDGQLLAQTLQPPDGVPAATHNVHCLYCLTHAASFGLPPAAAVMPPMGAAVTKLLPHAVRRVHPRLIWLIPAVRAPPGAACALFSSTRHV